VKQALFCLFVVLFLTSSLSAVTYPQLALGGGYECLVLVTNKLPTPFTGGLFLLKGNQVPWDTPYLVDGEAGEGATVNFSLAPLGSRRIFLQGFTELEVGYLDVRAYGDSLEDDVTVSFFYQYKVKGQLVDSTGVSASINSAGNLFPVEKTSTVNSGFAWARFSALDPFEINLTLYDSEGEIFDQKTMTFNGHEAKFITEVFDNIPDGFVGHVRLVSTQKVAMIALRFEQVADGFQLTSAPVETFDP
jgi:hypothetical protein